MNTKNTRKSNSSKPAPKVAKKTKAARPTEVPTFLNADGTVLIDKRNDKPVRLKGRDFPAGVEGYKAYCDYMIATWVWKREAKVAPDIARKTKRVERLREQIAKLEAELGSNA